ncbi:MAG: Gldg family protein, partial [Oscillospiraceae bacterium]|nr:Gldg family protein [Oscillospiraceae bacterium]
MKLSFNKKKLQYGSASALFVVVFIAIVVVLNIFASFLTERFSLKLDMTAEGQYSLSEESRNMLRELENPVTIYILSPKSEMEKSESGKRTVEMVARYGSALGSKV